MFARSGVEAPAKEIADAAGVGVGTVYRHFPRRSDLVIAVFKQEVDACADAAGPPAAENPPFVALEQWLHRFTNFVATKHGLAQALHSGDPAFNELPAYFRTRFGPALVPTVRCGRSRANLKAGGDLTLLDPVDGEVDLSLVALPVRSGCVPMRC